MLQVGGIVVDSLTNSDCSFGKMVHNIVDHNVVNL